MKSLPFFVVSFDGCICAGQAVPLIGVMLKTLFTEGDDRHRLANIENGQTAAAHFVAVLLGLSQVMVEMTGRDSIIYLLVASWLIATIS